MALARVIDWTEMFKFDLRYCWYVSMHQKVSVWCSVRRAAPSLQHCHWRQVNFVVDRRICGMLFPNQLLGIRVAAQPMLHQLNIHLYNSLNLLFMRYLKKCCRDILLATHVLTNNMTWMGELSFSMAWDLYQTKCLRW